MATASDLQRRAFTAFTPRPSRRLIQWACDYVVTDQGSPYDPQAYPHHGAPGGPCDALDFVGASTVWLQWASRLGKTFLGQAAMMRQATCSPCPMMFASSDQKLAVEVTARTYRMLERCEPLKGELRCKTRRKQDCVELLYCRQYIAWARSVSTLADKAVQFGHANEIDKWERTTTSKEADPLKLFTDRFKEFPVHKRVMESTPSIKGKSRIERGMLQSTNCRYWVPCPFCKRYQVLRMGNGTEPGGIVWDKRDGKHDKELARLTARYICKHCERPISSDYRGRMMRLGVWCPEGCTVNDDWAAEIATEWRKETAMWRGWEDSPWIIGKPLRDGKDAGYQLSSLYALQLTWGDIAAEHVECHSRPVLMQNFVNQWLGETWEVTKNKTDWEQLGEKCINQKLPRGIVPKWASMLTVGVDRQEDKFPWVVEAWGPERTSATIAYGEAESLEEIYLSVINQQWAHEDGGASLPVSFTLCDSGYKPDGVYEFCVRCSRGGVQVWPCKGSNHALDADYRMSKLGPNTSMPGMVLFHVDTIRSQLWIDRQLSSLGPTDAGGYSLYKGTLGEHQDFLEQITNDSAVDDLDGRNNVRQNWERANTNIPNDFRDCRRYAYVAMLIATSGRPIAPRSKAMEAPAPRRAVVSGGATRPDGRAW